MSPQMIELESPLSPQPGQAGSHKEEEETYESEIKTGTLPPLVPSMQRGRSPSPSMNMSRGEIEEEEYKLDSLDEIDNFDTTIGLRQVRPSQRLRSLAIDSTKSWTRPLPRDRTQSAMDNSSNFL